MTIPPAGPHLFVGGCNEKLETCVVEASDFFQNNWVDYAQEQPLPGFPVDVVLDDDRTLLAGCRLEGIFYSVSTTMKSGTAEPATCRQAGGLLSLTQLSGSSTSQV